jgi:hypothetical protein
MKTIVTHLMLPLLALFGVSAATSIAESPKKGAEALTGTLETLIVANGTVAMDLDVNRLNGLDSGAKSTNQTLRFQAAKDSFLPILVFNGELRGPTPGEVALTPENSALLPAALNASFNQLVLERYESGERFEVGVRDAHSGFVFFSVEGSTYQYDAASHSFQLNGGRLVIAEEFAKAMGRPADAGVAVGTLSMNATLRTIETRNVVNGAAQSAVMPAASVAGDQVEAVANGPDVIVGDMPSMVQSGSSGTQVGLAVATTSCNAGNQELNWFALPSVDHPVIPQNLYRMSANQDRMEQIGQGWVKHAFTALQQNACSFGCQSAANGTHLGVGCSDPYDTSLNGSQTGVGSRAFINPFTGAYPSTARDHTGHSHNGSSHRVLVNQSDLNTSLNAGATYFAETQYVTPHEYAWCQSHPGECNMYNNASYRQFNVSGTTSFSFSPAAATVRTQPALKAWSGSTLVNFQPAPGADGQGFIAYKVTGPTNGMYHYEYAVNNQNLDRAIQSFGVPLGCGVTISNVDFHAPLNGPGFANDGTLNSAGYSNAAWTPTQTQTGITWASETFAQNQNANAIRWGTTYNFRFDSNRPPQAANATVGFFKTGSPMTVAIQAPTPDSCSPLAVTTAVSRKTHGAAGTFDIDMPFTGSAGVECRSGGENGNHTIVVSFSNNVVSGNAQVVDGIGSVVGSPTFSANTMTVNLTGVPITQQLTLKFTGVTDTSAQVLPDTQLVVKVLMGDVNGSSSVGSSDIGQVKSEAGNAVTNANFREDITAEGNIGASDVSAVKSNAGATL